MILIPIGIIDFFTKTKSIGYFTEIAYVEYKKLNVWCFILKVVFQHFCPFSFQNTPMHPSQVCPVLQVLG